MPFSFKHDMIMNKYFLPNRPLFNPTQEEIEAIRKYTDKNTGIYSRINQFIIKLTSGINPEDALKDEDRKVLYHLQNIFLKYRGDAVVIDPVSNELRIKVLYRGMKNLPEELYRKLIRTKPGNVVHLSGPFVSTSYLKSIAEEFATGRDVKNSVVLIIVRRLHPGIQFMNFSVIKREEEVVLPYGFWNRLKILRRERRGKIWYIYVEEI